MTTTAAPDPQTAIRFTRATFDVLHGGGREARTGYRPEATEGSESPWGITRYGSTGKTWAVWHIPTGLLVRSSLPTLSDAKSLCSALETSNGHNLTALAAQPFGRVPKRDTEAHQEALAVFDVLRTWLREHA